MPRWFRSKGLTRPVILLLVLVALIMVVCIVPMLLRPRKASYQASSAPAAINPAQEVDSKSLQQTVVVATLDCPLPEHKSAIWCSTFQMAWDKFKADVIGEPIELLGKELANAKWTKTSIFEALQKIDFVLSRTGVVLKSESSFGTTRASRDDPPREMATPRHFRLDGPFLICIKKRWAAATPFFLMWVDNAELMQPATRDP